MNNEFRQHILRSLEQNTRSDGRGLLDYRQISVETGISKNAEGSARVKMGETEVLAGVKMEVGKPFPDRPDEGAIMVNVELVPLSNPDFEAGPPSINAIELARVVDRGIRESKAIDLKKLAIKKGEKCWVVVIDIVPLNASGNLFDASALAAVAAIRDARFPKYENDEVDYKTRTDVKLPLDKVPLSVTVLKLGKHYIVDPLPDEEQNLDARLTVAVIENDVLCALQKGGDNALFTADVDRMVSIALEKAKELRKYLG